MLEKWRIALFNQDTDHAKLFILLDNVLNVGQSTPESDCFDVEVMLHETKETSKERERRKYLIKRGEVETRLVKGVPRAE